MDFKNNTFANTDGIIYKLVTILLSPMTTSFPALDQSFNRDHFICRRDWQNCAIPVLPQGQISAKAPGHVNGWLRRVPLTNYTTEPLANMCGIIWTFGCPHCK